MIKLLGRWRRRLQVAKPEVIRVYDELTVRCNRIDRAINMLTKEHNYPLDRMRRSFDVPPPELYGARDPNRGDDR